MKLYSYYTINIMPKEGGPYFGNVLYGRDGIAPFRKCYDHYRPNMKGGHRHNHVLNRTVIINPSKRARQCTRKAYREMEDEWD